MLDVIIPTRRSVLPRSLIIDVMAAMAGVRTPPKTSLSADAGLRKGSSSCVNCSVKYNSRFSVDRGEFGPELSHEVNMCAGGTCPGEARTKAEDVRLVQC